MKPNPNSSKIITSFVRHDPGKEDKHLLDFKLTKVKSFH